MKKEIIVCHKEREYACRLVDYLNRHSMDRYLALAMTNTEEMISYAKKKTVQVLLLDEEYEETLVKCKDVIKHCFLVTRNATESAEHIVMYDAASHIQQRLLHILYPPEVNGQAKDIAVEAVISFGSEHTIEKIAAWVPDKQYLHWEWKAFSSVRQDSHIEELLYSMKCREENAALQLPKYLYRTEQYEVLPAAKYFMDMRSLTKEDVSWFLAVLKNAGYEGVYMHLDFACIGDISFLSLFSKIWVSVAEEVYLATSEYQHFLQYLEYGQIAKDKVVIF